MLDFLAEQGKIIMTSVLGLYIVVNPSGVASIFLGLTKDMEPGPRRMIAIRAVVTGAILLMCFAVAGTYLFRYFKITGAALQIAGGIFVFGVAFALARGKEGEFFGETQEQAAAKGAPGSVAYYPLAVPLIAGPASITFVMTLTPEATNPWSWGVLLAAIGSVTFLTLLSMLRLVRMQERLGPGLSLIWPRIMGLVLAVIAVQFVIDGVEEVVLRYAEQLK